MEDDLLRVSKRRRLEHMTVASPRPRSGVNLGKPSDAVGAHARAQSPALSPELAAKASALTSTRGFAKCGSPPPRSPAAGPSPPPLVEHPSGSSDDDVGLPNNKINSRPDLPFDLPASHGGASGTSVNKPPPPPAAEDDEAFARRLQEEENARYQAEREESQRRAAEWRRAHEAMMAAAEIEEDLDEDADGIDDDDDDDDVGVDGVPGIEALGDEGLGAGGVAESDADADAREQRRAARRALARARRAQMTELHRFMGALHNTINAAGETAADRAQLAALVMSDRDFTEDDTSGCWRWTTPTNGGGSPPTRSGGCPAARGVSHRTTVSHREVKTT